MKKPRTARFLSLVLALVLSVSLCVPALASGNWTELTEPGTGCTTSHDYSDRGSPTKFFLYANEKGGLTRVEAPASSKQLHVEEYDRSLRFLSGKLIPFDGLEKWGGFYAGANYNFIITGQNNISDHPDSTEVVRVLKYSKDWQYLGKASVYGAYTNSPFHFGNLRCAESGDILYIHTSHAMYNGHQSNMILVVRESDMTVTETNCKVSDYPGYVSHSFNQYIMADSLGNLILGNHGDAYPRTMQLYRLDGRAGKETITGGSNSSYVNADNFIGLAGGATYAMLGGIAETTSGYLMAYSQRASGAIGDLYQIKLAYIAKKDFGSDSTKNQFQVRQLTDTKADLMNWDPFNAPDQGNPYLVPTSLSGGYIIWKSGKGEISWTTYDASGQTGTIRTGSGRLSDCQPIFFNGKVVWFATEQTDVEKFSLTFYTLDASGLTAIDPTAPPAPSTPVLPDNPSDLFRDVAANHWALDYIRTCAEKGIVNGVGDGMFNPEGEVTYKEFIVMLTRACYAEDVSRITDTEGKPWYYPNMMVAQDCYLMGNTDMRRYGGWPEPVVADNAINRYEMSAVLYGAAFSYGKPASGGHWRDAVSSIKDYDQFSDSNSFGMYYMTVPLCYMLGVLTGAEDGCFHGDRTVTRAQACAVIVRMMDVIGDPPAGETHEIMVIYRGTEAANKLPVVSQQLPEGQAYSFTSPEIPGCTADRPVVSGVMGRCARYVMVTYTPN
ncbi:MAG: S-layer homology domain-containing protein [Oscillibacter sp.]|nr:S-layer homology domain-containing protein [Oscillibacter sp.]